MTRTRDKTHQLLEKYILPQVEQPGQYVGHEPGSIRKDLNAVDVSVALCFPDTYPIGMSHLGFQILYDIINRQPRAAAERAYAPLKDMQMKMKEHKIPLFTVESFTPVCEFDLAGFTLQSELLYSNILMMLEHAGVPLRSRERTRTHPLILAGGPGALAPEPLAQFIDVFFIGDAEESLPDFLALYQKLKDEHFDRDSILLEAAQNLSGIYVPRLYRPVYTRSGSLRAIEPKTDTLPERITAARVRDLDSTPFPTRPVVPLVEATHEHINLEIMRGCGRGCRFCHAGMTNRPCRFRSPDTLLQLAVECYKNTGYDEIALTSLSSSDYPYMPELLERLTDHFTPLNVSISMPSLRVSDQLSDLVGSLNAVRKSGLTIAPEAATRRLRDRIKKDITDEDLFEGTAAAVEAGWRLVKLYFMVGLPGETQRDITAIGSLCKRVLDNADRAAGKRALKLNVTVSPFVPKPHTPLQWEAMETLDKMRAKWDRIRINGGSRLRYKWHDPAQSVVEGAFARGDRRMGDVLLDAYRAGAVFDAWNDQFNFPLWKKVMASHGLHPESDGDRSHPNSPFRERTKKEFLPWQHIDCGVSMEHMLRERERAFEEGDREEGSRS